MDLENITISDQCSFVGFVVDGLHSTSKLKHSHVVSPMVTLTQWTCGQEALLEFISMEGMHLLWLGSHVSSKVLPITGERTALLLFFSSKKILSDSCHDFGWVSLYPFQSTKWPFSINTLQRCRMNRMSVEKCGSCLRNWLTCHGSYQVQNTQWTNAGNLRRDAAWN